MPNLSDKEIVQLVSRNLDAAKPFLVPTGFIPFSQKEADLGIKKSRRFIDVLISNNSGESSYYSFPTLYHKYENAKDNLRLLSGAGIKIKFTNLPTDRATARTAALKNIKNVKLALMSNLDFLVKTNKEIEGRGELDDSLVEEDVQQEKIDHINTTSCGADESSSYSAGAAAYPYKKHRASSTDYE
ncbi:hypothetical protein [Candidatus Finniella inopinata]|uniref:Uncharacterized protein n=1 Tax=Candidatus Finniella inopinata TaxID=1696036 RepID=A0A4V2DZS4_9PROT|nr:hypothetical protein [Candidatus Finniella inopinata]RZI46067.1 hypothetical protein EQU50_03810 [Candidatus Finniella inopinata]